MISFIRRRVLLGSRAPHRPVHPARRRRPTAAAPWASRAYRLVFAPGCGIPRTPPPPSEGQSSGRHEICIVFFRVQRPCGTADLAACERHILANTFATTGSELSDHQASACRKDRDHPVQPRERSKTAFSATNGSFVRMELRASATSTHRRLPQPKTKARRRSQQQCRRRGESGSNVAFRPWLKQSTLRLTCEGYVPFRSFARHP
jgi:hypothetical protein